MGVLTEGKAHQAVALGDLDASDQGLFKLGQGPEYTYDASRQSLTYSFKGRQYEFSAADIASSDDYGFNAELSDGDDRISTTIGRMRVDGEWLDYVNSASFSRTDGGGNVTEGGRAVFGQDTLYSAVPVAGGASYRTSGNAFVINNSGSGSPTYNRGDLDGLSFSVDFLSGAVRTTVSLDGLTALISESAEPRDFGVLHGEGALAASTSGFDGQFVDPGIEGEFSGAFYGPTAEEMAYVYVAEGSDFTVMGTVAGIRNDGSPAPFPNAATGLDAVVTNLPGDTAIGTVGFRQVGGVNVASPLGDGATVTYLVSTDGIEVESASGTHSFGPSDISEDYSDLVVFGDLDATVAGDRLTLSIPTVDGVRLSYVRHGIFSVTNLAGLFDEFELFAFGDTTEGAGMPVSGMASYSNTFYASISDVANPGSPSLYTADDSTGSASFIADFGLGRVYTSIDLNNAEHFINANDVKDFGVLQGEGQIAAGSPAFSGDITSAGVTGGFEGAFFGPSADEVGMIFNVSGADFRTTGYVMGSMD